MKTEQQIREQIEAQRQRIASLQAEIKTAEGLIGGLLFCLNELPGHVDDPPLPEWMAGDVAPEFGEPLELPDG